MPKGDTHVKKHSKGANRTINSNDLKVPNESDGEIIGEIIGAYGSCRFNVQLVNDQVSVQAAATRSFSHGPKKEIIKIKDYVVVQPGISRGQYFIIHKYNENEVQKLYDLGHIGKPKQSAVVDETDITNEPVVEENTELNLDDIWDI